MEWFLESGSAVDIPGYDCRSPDITPEMISNKGEQNIILGVVFIMYGIIAEITYGLAISVMIRPDFLRYSCYKIMLVLGIYDMFAILVNSIITGYLWIVGGWFCTHPNLDFVSGAIGLGLWTGACMTCFVLVLNRLMDLWSPHFMAMIFKGSKTYVVLLIPFVYSVYFTLFTHPLLFSSHMTAWFFDPFIRDGEGDQFYNIPHTANNLLVVVLTCILYGLMCYILSTKYSEHSATKLSWNQKSIIVQSTAICMANLIAALIYVYMQFFSTPSYLILIGHMSWQAGHGIPAFVYMFVNKTIRREILRSIGFNIRIKPKSGTLRSGTDTGILDRF